MEKDEMHMWTCPECTLENDWDSTRCEVCTHRRPRSLWQKKKFFQKLENNLLVKQNLKTEKLKKKNEQKKKGLHIEVKKIRFNVKKENNEHMHSKNLKKISNFYDIETFKHKDNNITNLQKFNFIICTIQIKAKQKIKLLEAGYKKYNLKDINNFLISDLLRSKKELIKCFGQMLTGRSRILEYFLKKIYNKLKIKSVQGQFKNIGILHKLLRVLEKLINAHLNFFLSCKTYLRLKKISKMKNFPLKSLSIISRILRVTSLNRDSLNNFSNKLSIPIHKFFNVDWNLTFLGRFGSTKEKIEDKWNCKIRLNKIETLNKLKKKSLIINIRSIQKWKINRCKVEILRLLNNRSKHKTMSKGMKKHWQQVLDPSTGSYYYWDLITQIVRWEAPSEGFIPAELTRRYISKEKKKKRNK